MSLLKDIFKLKQAGIVEMFDALFIVFIDFAIHVKILLPQKLFSPYKSTKVLS
jgi:hypothetical protein